MIEPTLLTNQCATCDLKQKDYIIDGVNGIDFVQTNAEGVPVFVEPTLLVNEMADVDLKQRDITIDGVNGFDYVQLGSRATGELKRPIDEMTLMVKGVPVTVNPESMLSTNTMGRVHLGLDLEVGYNTEVLNLAQKEKRHALGEKNFV